MLFATTAGATPQASRQSYETCSLITSEYLTVVQLLSRGFAPDTLKQALPDISAKAQQRVQALSEMVNNEGLTATYSRINSEYAHCAKMVYQEHGVPAPGSRENHFHFCAGENKVRYEILLAAMLDAAEVDVRPQLAPQHQPVVAALYELYKKEGADGAFDNLASELKYCINNHP